MLPVIFSIGPITLYSLWLVLFLAILLGAFAIWKRGRELHYDEEALFDAFLAVGWWTFIGARLFFVIFNLNQLGLNPGKWFDLLSVPGLNIVGGLLFSGLAIKWQIKKNKWDFYTVFDLWVTGLVLVQAVMSLGSFVSGSNLGIVTNSFLGVRFPGMYDKRIPVQLIEGGWLIFLYFYLWQLESKYRTISWYKGSKSEALSGFITAVYCLGYGLAAAVLVWLKPASMVWYGVRLDYLIYLALAGYGGWLLNHRSDGDVFKRWSNRTDKSKNLRNQINQSLKLGDDILG